MDSGGSSDRGGKDAAQIEQPNSLTKRKDDKPWSVASSVDSPSALEDLRGTRINIWRAIENGPTLFAREIGRVWQVVIPLSSSGSETSELIPTRGMRAGRKVDTCKRRVGCQRDGLRLDVAERSDPRPPYTWNKASYTFQ
jgi:hypothetical protein